MTATTWVKEIIKCIKNLHSGWVSLLFLSEGEDGGVTIKNQTMMKKNILLVFVLFSLWRLGSLPTIFAQGITTPPFAASTQMWEIELDDGTTQIWSDYINLPECNKEELNNEKADCYRDMGIFYKYDIKYANEKRTVLCPSPWRMPAITELEQLADYGAVSDDRCMYVLNAYYKQLLSGPQHQFRYQCREFPNIIYTGIGEYGKGSHRPGWTPKYILYRDVKAKFFVRCIR
jgi:hypothetical protein